MALSVKQMSIIVTTFGVVSFIFGVIAENKKPAAGNAITSQGGVICQYPSDPTVVLGYLSVGFLVASAIFGYVALFYPYKGKSVPQGVLFKSGSFMVFFNIALLTTGLAGAFLLWPTITEQLHRSRNVHQNPNYDCPTAKTGLLGGGAFLSLDSSLFWLIALMLAGNVREDFFDDSNVVEKEEGGKVAAEDYVLEM